MESGGRSCKHEGALEPVVEGASLATEPQSGASVLPIQSDLSFFVFGAACMPRRDDSAVREKDQSQLLIKWVDEAGSKFVERTKTHDISQTGISFYLKAPIWVDTHLTITIASSVLFGRLHTKTAKVVRIQTDASGGQLIGARFDE
jgi:hypothetical protein